MFCDRVLPSWWSIPARIKINVIWFKNGFRIVCMNPLKMSHGVTKNKNTNLTLSLVGHPSYFLIKIYKFVVGGTPFVSKQNDDPSI